MAYCCGQSLTERDSSHPPNPSVSPCQYDSTNVPKSFIHHSDGQLAHYGPRFYAESVTKPQAIKGIRYADGQLESVHCALNPNKWKAPVCKKGNELLSGIMDMQRYNVSYK